jgi:hypothetical protein
MLVSLVGSWRRFQDYQPLGFVEVAKVAHLRLMLSIGWLTRHRYVCILGGRLEALSRLSTRRVVEAAKMAHLRLMLSI